MLGEFIEFKGHQGDMAALKSIKRSKVSRIIVQKASLFGLGTYFPSLITVLLQNYCDW